MNWILGKLAPVKVKSLGALDPFDVARAEAYQERMQNDATALPQELRFKVFSTESWVRGNRKHPKVPLSRLGGAR